MTSEAEKEFSRLVPRLLREGAVEVLAQLYHQGGLPLPEAMAVKALCGETGPDARCGIIGFSFPVWRFLAQGGTGASLFEAFGLRRLTRATDIRDASLPDPARDEFGTGFYTLHNGVYIEYRRAYVLVARLDGVGAGAIIIRNNSYFFGRDRLPRPVSVWNGAVTVAELQDMTPEDFTNGKMQAYNAEENAEMAATLLGAFETYDAQLHRWLLADGLTYLCAFLREKLVAGRGLPYIGYVRNGQPPWVPADVQPLTSQLVTQLEESPEAFRRSDLRLTLLSGPSGDVPLA